MDTSEDVDSASEDDNISPEDKVALFAAHTWGSWGLVVAGAVAVSLQSYPSNLFLNFFANAAES